MEEKACIKCEKNMSHIIYGYPTQDLYEVSKEKGWVIGGCMISPIKYICKRCKIIWSINGGFEEQV